jgi:hypothetical protein
MPAGHMLPTDDNLKEMNKEMMTMLDAHLEKRETWLRELKTTNLEANLQWNLLEHWWTNMENVM